MRLNSYFHWDPTESNPFMNGSMMKPPERTQPIKFPSKFTQARDNLAFCFLSIKSLCIGSNMNPNRWPCHMPTGNCVRNWISDEVQLVIRYKLNKNVFGHLNHLHALFIAIKMSNDKSAIILNVDNYSHVESVAKLFSLRSLVDAGSKSNKSLLPCLLSAHVGRRCWQAFSFGKIIENERKKRQPPRWWNFSSTLNRDARFWRIPNNFYTDLILFRVALINKLLSSMKPWS